MERKKESRGEKRDWKERYKKKEKTKRGREKRIDKLPSICICDIKLRELQSYIVLLSIPSVYYILAIIKVR